MSKKTIERLLLVEDNPADACLLREMLNEAGSRHSELTHVQRMSDAERHLLKHGVDIVLLDLGLPDAEGLGAVRRAHVAAPHVPLVVLTGLDDETLGTQALQEGAQDYLIKGEIETRGLLRALRYAVERKAMEEALFAEKERAEVTLNCIGDAVACTDIAGKITFLNMVAEQMTGWPRQEAAGRPVGEVFRILDATLLAKSSLIPRRWHWAAISRCICPRNASSSGATNSKFPSRIPSRPSTTAKAVLPEQSSFSAT
jgi:CheY-like chemotaxis protein